MLPSLDAEYLVQFPGHALSVDGGMICVLIPNFPLPPGLDRQAADLLLRLAAGYPDIPPDMWWFNPAVGRRDGVDIPATQVREHYLGRQWQRWSRHFAQGQWKYGLDSLESYLALVRKELVKAAVVQAA
jgi:hypothetical protein